MKEIKGTYRSEECFEYKVHGKTYWITPDNSGIYWNGKKCRLEYIHEGTKGGISVFTR